MAHQGHRVDQKKFCCSLCLDLLKDPVTTTCGHSYCRSCINKHWDKENQRRVYSCPLCRETFRPRPDLKKNTMLADLVEDLKKTGLQTKRQRELQMSRQNIQQRIQSRERDVKLLQQDVGAINSSADKAVEKSEKIFTQLIRLLEQRRSDVKQQLRSQQEAEVSRVKELEAKLEQEISELKRKDKELETHSHTQDHNQFLQDYPSLSQLGEPTDSASISQRPLKYFEDVTAAVTALQDKLQDILSETWTNLSHMEAEVDLFGPSDPQPETRAQFLNYACDITMDPNTAHEDLLLSDENRKVTLMEEQQSYYFSSESFIYCWQVMSQETLTGRCYWEVEPRGDKIQLAVAYSNISRDGRFRKSGFGKNDMSWALEVDESSYIFWHNGVKTPVSGPRLSRIGVYLDHSAGVLSFYCVSRKKNMTLLHRVQTTFTQPLHAGLLMHYCETTAEFIKLK